MLTKRIGSKPRVKEGAISQVLVCLGYSNVRISKNIVDIKEG